MLKKVAQPHKGTLILFKLTRSVPTGPYQSRSVPLARFLAGVPSPVVVYVCPDRESLITVKV